MIHFSFIKVFFLIKGLYLYINNYRADVIINLLSLYASATLDIKNALFRGESLRGK
jgi:hypothetical protein